MTAERSSPTPSSPSPAAIGPAPVALGAVRELVRGLDREQRRAVTFGEGPLLVVAGPGTGKTEVITRRVAWLIATGRARPSEILALTFTERAADEMQARVDVLLPYGQVDTAVHTFHAFGDRLLRVHGHEIGLPPEPRLIGRPEAIALLRAHLPELGLQRFSPLGDPTRFLGLLAELFGRAKQAGIAPADLAAFAAELRAGAVAVNGEGEGVGEAVASLLDEAAAHEELARAYQQYTVLMRERSLIDHADQVGLALRLVEERPSVRAALRRRYRYLVVDEAQDADVQQLRLVRAISGEHGNVAFVGDDDQAIYGFRGGNGDALQGLASAYPTLRHVVLRRNHRSRAPILAVARRLIRHNDPHRLEVTAGVDKSLVALRRGRRPRLVEHRAFATATDEAEHVATEIVARLASGAEPGSIAVLVRTNADAGPVLDSLRVRGVPVRASGASGLFSHPEVRDLLALVRAIAAPARSEDLYAVLASGTYAIGGEDLTALLHQASRSRRPLWEVCLEAVAHPGSVRMHEASRAELGRFVDELRESVRLAHRRSAGEVVYSHLRRSGWLGRLVKDAEQGAEGPLRRVARAFEMIRRVAEVGDDPRIASLEPLLTERLDDGSDLADEDAEDGQRVAVLTVHQAKGLEFEVVYLIGLAEGRFPLTTSRPKLELPVAMTGLRPASDPDALIAEERRLFYVGLTRARDELVLTHARMGARGGRARRPSPFIAEALGLPARAPENEARDLMNAFPQEDDRTAATITAPGGSRQRQLVLSFSQIDDYLVCPTRYRLRHDLRVPTPAHHALVVGSALHQGVAVANLARSQGHEPDAAAVMRAFRSAWVSEGFLSPAHEEARFAAAEAALRRFLDAAGREPDRRIVAVERPFDVRIGRDRVRGRFDAVSRTQAGTVITDYKSGDIRDASRARQRARSSLQLAIYALAHEAETGELPAAVELHFLEGGTVGATALTEAQLERTRDKVTAAADGIRAGRFEATPGYPACQWCPYRRICPSAA